MLEPKELGKLYGMSEKAFNNKLRDLCLQDKDSDGFWEATESALDMCTQHDWKKGGKSGHTLKWSKSKIMKILGY